MIKALFIAYYFPPVGGAGVQRVQKFVRYLPDEGFLPTVVAGPAKTVSRWTPQDTTLLDGIPREVKVYRVEGAAPAEATKWKRRQQSLLAQPTEFEEWWVKSATEVALTAVSPDTSFIFATMPPFETALAADAVSQRTGLPWVADFRDPWAVDEIGVYLSSLHRGADLRRMEKLLSRAAVVVMNTPEAVNAIRRHFPRLHHKNIVSITNGFDGEDFEPVVPVRTDRKFRIVHAGSLLTETGLQSREQKIHRLLGGVNPNVDILTRSPVFLVEAVVRWCETRPEVLSDLELVFAGNASGKDREVVAHPVLAKVATFPGYLSHSASLELVRTADLLFLPMHNLPVGERATTAPGKTFEYMASTRPILAAIPDGDAQDILRQCGTALICRPDDVSHMVEILNRVYNDWKSGVAVAKSNTAYVQQFERKNLTKALAQVFRSLPVLAPLSAALQNQ